MNRYSISSLGELQQFLDESLADISIFGSHVILTEDKCRILFTSPKAGEMIEKLRHLTGFVMDFTFNTNEHGLLLGVIGPVGLWQEKDSEEPHMRFFPAIFMLADKEDKEAHHLLLDLYLNTADSIDMKVTDGYVDCACLESLISRLPPERGVDLHRCLQHTRTNVKCEGKGKVRRPGVFDRRTCIDIADKRILGST